MTKSAVDAHFYCIAHEYFSWELPGFMTVIGTGNYKPKTGIAMCESFPDLAFKNVYLGEYVALYAIRRLLLEAKASGFVGVCHYRRFALTRPIGELNDFNFHAHPDMLSSVKPEHFYHDGKTPILPTFVTFGGTVLQQYAANCVARDLLNYFGDAIDCGVITDAEASSFLSQNGFIVAPTVSYIPVSWFVDIVGDLELVMTRFYLRHYIQRDGYLSRSMAFCCERLHALLLKKKADQWGWDRLIAQPLTLMST